MIPLKTFLFNIANLRKFLEFGILFVFIAAIVFDSQHANQTFTKVSSIFKDTACSVANKTGLSLKSCIQPIDTHSNITGFLF